MHKTSLILGLLVCVVGIGVGLMIVMFFGANRTSTDTLFQTPLSASAIVVASSAPAAEETVAPLAVASTVTPTQTLVATPVSSTVTIAATSASSPPTTVPPAETVATTATASPSNEAAPPTAATSDESYIVYTVKAGDTLKGIAEAYGVTIADILATNTITNPDALPIGQELRIPQPQ